MPCPNCGSTLFVIWVHGHGQCTVCGMNILPCCEGDSSDGECSTICVSATNPISD
jgi:uncharacterized protein (DUF983 family)